MFFFFLNTSHMDNILTETENFDFSNLSLTSPTGIQGGSYFTRILNSGNPLYVQCPSCKTKQGIVNSGRKIYSDVLLTKDNGPFIEWIENLESHCQKLILDKSDDWFENSLDLNDIEESFISPLKLYKSGSMYILKCSLDKSPQGLNKPACVVYDENNESISIDEINNETSIIPLIHFNGIKFTNKNFQIEIIMRQVMKLNNINNTPEQLIKKPTGVNTLEEIKDLENKVLDEERDVVATEVIEPPAETEATAEVEAPAETDATAEVEAPVEVEAPADAEVLAEGDESTEVERPDEVEAPEDDNIELESNGDESDYLSDLEEIDVNVTDDEKFHLKDKSDVYYKIYKMTRDKIKDMQKNELTIFFENKQINTNNILDDLYESDDDYLLESDEENGSDASSVSSNEL